MTRRFVDNIELWLSAAGLLVVWGAAALLGPSGVGVWQIAAVTALGVSVVHGLIFWVVRRRQRLVRSESVHTIREMLTDQVTNQLAIMRMWIPDDADRAMLEAHFDGIDSSISEIDRMVNGLSEEKLRAWETMYANAAEPIRLAAPAP
ncbi:hypothetical protein [Rubrivirga marina]|uniref:Uncharacterized protein n=1 Tax=Rubrivirga marina TaxID=1196024 RepID=A0A271IY99_9BACT|nr:hypothetical protein [Rubrivirga marina]PAP76057.1 hypothetical protein BSZ37_06175 [Rubrivirga marina]